MDLLHLKKKVLFFPQGKYLQATSEEEIFTHLGLEFIPPSERNA